MTLPKLAILDRDSTLCFASKDPASPLYYVLSPDCLVLKPGAREAVQLLKVCGIPIVLATRQRGISKGLITREQVTAIHTKLESLLSFEFDGVCVEEGAEDKGAIYQAIVDTYPVKPSEIVLFDDSARERGVASKMGISVYDGTNLLESVINLLSL